MANRPKLTPTQWEQVKQASIAGTPDAAIEAEYGIGHSTLTMRRSREGWPSPSSLAHKARNAAREAAEAADRVSGNVSNVARGQKSAATFILEEMKERTITSFGKLNARACSAMDAAAIPEVETMRDLNMLTQIAERTGRLNEGKGGMNLQVNVAVSPWQRSSRSSERVIDVEDSQ